MLVRLEDVYVELGAIPIVQSCALVAKPGEIVGLVGPNGSGKSTLLKAVYRALRPAAGAVWLDDDDLWALSARQSAQRTAVVAQERPSEFEFAVADIVLMGRAPHKGLLDRDVPADHRIVAEALCRVGMSHVAHRPYATLSGGEKQRVLVARALAQQSRLLVLDEPTNHLDVHAQLELLELVRSLRTTTVAALHDLNLAASYCDRVYVVDKGRLVADGAPADVLTPGLLASVFKVRAHCGPHPADGRFHIHITSLPTDHAGRPAPGQTSQNRSTP